MNNTTSLEYYDHIDDVINKHNINTYWRFKLNKVKKYINKNKKLPLKTLENGKKLYIWLHNQQYNYNHKKNNMINDVIYNLWREFIKEYSNYFLLP
jgi:hypothetical protein